MTIERPFNRRQFIQGVGAGAVLAPAAMRNAMADPNAVFTHGVASGDPLPTQVILWTRVTPPWGLRFR